MKRILYHTPFDYSSSPYSGWTRGHWEETFFVLMKGIAKSASPGRARQPIPGHRSSNSMVSDELEGFSRSFIMAAAWMKRSPDGLLSFRGETIDVAGLYRAGIAAGTDPSHPEYWGAVTDYSQHLVEMASLAVGLYFSRHLTWDRLSDAERDRVARYLFQCTKAKYHANNWLLFNVVTNAVLKKLGRRHSKKQIRNNLRACDSMYVGEGWYRDGAVNRIDYYNAWGFHYYYLLWSIIDGDSDPALARTCRERAGEFARSFRYFFAADGSAPCFGRSMIYRCGYLSVLALGYLLGCLDMEVGEIRTLCNANMSFFFSHPILTDAGHLSLGYLGPRDGMVEHYSCGGSPYWAGKAFSAFLIPENDPFWHKREEPLPIHRGDFSRSIPSAGFLIIGDGRTGHVQLINQKSYHDDPSYNDRYTRFAYSSMFGYEARTHDGVCACDAVLQFSADGASFSQRWHIEHLYCAEGFAASRYPLFEVDPSGTIHTSILVKDDCLVMFHQVAATRKNLFFREGGYALGFDDGEAEIISVEGAEAARKDGRISFIRSLCGYAGRRDRGACFRESGGTNVYHGKSVVPSLEFASGDTQRFYLASEICARVGGDSFQSLMEHVRIARQKNNTLELIFHDGEAAFIQIGEIGDIDVTLNGKRFAGAIVMARSSRDGSRWMVLDRDGSCSSG